MPQLQLPRIDADALRDRVRDVDLSRLADLGDELRHLDLAEGIRSLDVDALRRLDLDALRRLDLDALRHLGDIVERPDVDFAALRDSALARRVQGALGRGVPKRNAWDALSAPPPSATLLAGTVIVVGGALVGGLVAWLYQPGKGEQRRARIRRRLGRVVRKVRRTIRPA
jgi:hypothetical protein